jgi:methionyl-tRNA formyltransferase
MSPPIKSEKKPKVILLTYPGLYGATIIKKFMQAQDVCIVGICLSHRIFKGKGYLSTARAMINRTGFAFTIYSFIITDFSWLLLKLFPFCQKFNSSTEVVYTHDINSNETIEWLKKLAPDFIVSCYFNQLIGSKVISIPRLACVNMHPAQLPSFRGPDPCFRVMEHKPETIGLTIHKVDVCFDTGAILYQKKLPLPKLYSLLDMNMKLWSDGATLLTKWLSGKIETCTPFVQSENNASYFTWPNPNEVRRFRDSGYKLITLAGFIKSTKELF